MKAISAKANESWKHCLAVSHTRVVFLLYSDCYLDMKPGSGGFNVQDLDLLIVLVLQQHDSQEVYTSFLQVDYSPLKCDLTLTIPP